MKIGGVEFSIQEIKELVRFLGKGFSVFLLSVVISVLSLFGAYYAYKWFSDPYRDLVLFPTDNTLQLEQKRHVGKLIEMFFEKEQARQTICACYPNFLQQEKELNRNYVSAKEAQQLLDAKNKGNEQTKALAPGLLKAMKDTAELLDIIAKDYEYGLTDKKLFEEHFKSVFYTWYVHLHKFMPVYEADCRNCEFASFKRIGEAFYKQAVKEHRLSPISEENIPAACLLKK